MKEPLFLLLTLLLISCNDNTKANVEHKSNESEVLEKTTVLPFELDVNLNNEPVFNLLNGENEPLRGPYDQEIRGKATCSMSQVLEFDPADQLHVQTENVCDTWIVNDTLNIRLSAPYAGVGVILQVKNGSYVAQPYVNFAPDVVIGDQNRTPQIEIQKGMLVLDNTSFVVSDSIYGHLYLRALIDGDLKYYAQGYFRAKIEKE